MDKNSATETFTALDEDNADVFSQTLLFSTMMVISIATILVNCRIISIQFTTPLREIKEEQHLIGHFSIVVVLVVVLGGLQVLTYFRQLELFNKSLVLCVGGGYLRDVVVSIIPLNVIAIAHKRRNFQVTFGEDYISVKKCIILLWTTAGLVNLPSIFAMTIIRENRESRCQPKKILDNLFLTSFYEEMKLLLVVFLPAVYAFSCLCEMKSKIINYFFQTTDGANQRRRRMVNSVRLNFLHTTLFILVWLPSQLYLAAYKIWSMTYTSGINIPEFDQYFQKSLSFSVQMFAVVSGIYFILNDIVQLCFDEHLQTCPWYICTYKRHVRFAEEESLAAGTIVDEECEEISNEDGSTSYVKFVSQRFYMEKAGCSRRVSGEAIVKHSDSSDEEDAGEPVVNIVRALVQKPPVCGILTNKRPVTEDELAESFV